MDIQTLILSVINALPPGLASDTLLALAVLSAISGAAAQIAALFGFTQVASLSNIAYRLLQGLAGNYGKAANASAPPIASGPTIPPSAISGLLLAWLLAVPLVVACTLEGVPITATPTAVTASASAVPANSLVDDAAVACAVDGVTQPVFVDLAALIPGVGTAIAGIDDALVHPAVVAFCASVGGMPVKVTVAAGK